MKAARKTLDAVCDIERVSREPLRDAGWGINGEIAFHVEGHVLVIAPFEIFMRHNPANRIKHVGFKLTPTAEPTYLVLDPEQYTIEAGPESAGPVLGKFWTEANVLKGWIR